MTDYKTHFSESAFWNKLSGSAAAAGRKAVEAALVLYYCYRDPDTPAKARAVILGALGYLILPLDLIPDFIPGVGFTDDLAGLATALTLLLIYVKASHRERAREQMRRWFPQEEQS